AGRRLRNSAINVRLQTYCDSGRVVVREEPFLDRTLRSQQVRGCDHPRASRFFETMPSPMDGTASRSESLAALTFSGVSYPALIRAMRPGNPDGSWSPPLFGAAGFAFGADFALTPKPLLISPRRSRFSISSSDAFCSRSATDSESFTLYRRRFIRNAFLIFLSAMLVLV